VPWRTLKGKFPQLSRGMVLTSAAIAIAMGAGRPRDGRHRRPGPAFPGPGAAPSVLTARRVLDLATDRTLTKTAQARARIRGHVWAQIEARGRVPRLDVAGKTLPGWLVIDMDATLVTAHSDKQRASATWKMAGASTRSAPGPVYPRPIDSTAKARSSWISTLQQELSRDVADCVRKMGRRDLASRLPLVHLRVSHR
jgi:hypothetical protein